jgi:hypothetical protein
MESPCIPIEMENTAIPIKHINKVIFMPFIFDSLL